LAALGAVEVTDAVLIALADAHISAERLGRDPRELVPPARRPRDDGEASIDEALETYSANVPTPPPNEPSSPGPFGVSPESGYTPGGGNGGCGCSVADRRAPLDLGLTLLGLLALGARRWGARKRR